MEKIISLDKFSSEKPSFVFRQGAKSVLVLKIGEKFFALDNRCPHEGYPLSQGKTDHKSCILTCNWHNWKFDLKNGKCLLGGDNVRTYPVSMGQHQIKVDLRDPPSEVIQENLLNDLKTAFNERDYGRICREITRLDFHKLDPLLALERAILWSFEKFEYGMGHPYAGAADWLALYSEFHGREERIICLTEAVDHISQSSLRHQRYIFEDLKGASREEYDEKKFFQYTVNEEVQKSESMAMAGIEKGLRFKDFEKVFSEIALFHYNDFGHSLIYVTKARFLSHFFDNPQIDRALILSLTRSLCYTTKEDLLPEFKSYAKTVESLEKGHLGATHSKSSPPALPSTKMSIEKTYHWLLEHSRYSASSLYESLLAGNALIFLKFDLKYQGAYDNPLGKDRGWLSFTHGITFSSAVRETCLKYPHLWPKALAQMASFYGRNNHHTDDSISLSDWTPSSQEKFEQEIKNKIFDHGMGGPIFSCHLLKTSMAIFEEIKHCQNQTQNILSAALNRFIHSPLKQKHVRRTARQSIDLVAKDFKQEIPEAPSVDFKQRAFENPSAST